jgi:predicted DNA-binding protein with PD1-like motif
LAKLFCLPKGASLFEELIEIAEKEKIRTAQVVGVGGVNRLTLAYYNRTKKKYEEHLYDEFLEVAGLTGNLTLKDGKPFLHIHGTFGRRDMSALAGHVISASVFPLLEVVITPTSNRALRRFDDETGLNVIYRTEQL